MTYYGERGVTAHVLDEKQLRTLEPNLRSGMKGGLLVPEDAVLYPPCAARFFTEERKKTEPRLQFGVPVDHIGESRVTLGDGSEIRAEFVVNAAGASAPDLTPGLRSRSGRDIW